MYRGFSKVTARERVKPVKSETCHSLIRSRSGSASSSPGSTVRLRTEPFITEILLGTST